MAVRYVSLAGAGLHDGTSEANAWTLPEATANHVAGDVIHVKAATYIADDNTSSSCMDIRTVGAANNPVIWIAYTTVINDFTIGDVQPVILDAGTNSLANAITTLTTIVGAVYHKLWGFELKNATSHGLTGSTTNNNIALYGCKIDANGTTSGRGIQWNDDIGLMGCEMTGNGLDAMDCDNGLILTHSKIHGEVAGTITTQNFVAIGNLFYNNGNGVNLRATQGGCIATGNIFDGDGLASNQALQFSGSTPYPDVITNNIFMDFGGNAIDFVNAGVEGAMLRGFNLFYGNSTDYDGLSLETTDVVGTSDPFTDSANRDYSLKTGSEALAAGIDAGIV